MALAMMGFLFFIGFIGLMLGPPILVVLTPRAYLLSAIGWAVLAIGLLWLDERNIPFQDLGILGGSDWLFTLWAVILATGAIIRLAAAHSYAPTTASQPADAGDRNPWLGWQLPIAALLAVFFMHWLRNRLAGYEPALLPHLATFLPAAVGAIALHSWVARRPLRATWRRSLDPRSFVVFFLSAVALVVAANAWTASRHLAKAREEADGQPFCLMTFAGRNQARQAGSLLELSPMVSRWGGAGFERFGPRWLYVDETAADPSEAIWRRDGDVIYRQSRVRPIENSGAKEFVAGHCKPANDGGIKGL